MCQLAAKREHRLKQLAKLLSRILAPHGSKPVRCSLGVCSASLAAAMVFAGSSEDVVVCTQTTLPWSSQGSKHSFSKVWETEQE